MSTASRRFISLIIGLLALGLSLASEPLPAEAAGPVIVVDSTTPAFGCGRYDGMLAYGFAPLAINTAPSNSTVVICPGTYNLTGLGGIEIIAKTKIKITRAFTGPGSVPTLQIDPAISVGMRVTDSTGVTIDGVILDARANTQAGYVGMMLKNSTVTIKNAGLIGANTSGSGGIVADNSSSTQVRPLTISNSYVSGYQGTGISMLGAVKLNLSTSHLDATDGGNIALGAQLGIVFNGDTSDPVGPTGTVTRCRIIHNVNGVAIWSASKVTVSNNIFVDNYWNVTIQAAMKSADSNKITGNTFLNLKPSYSGAGVNISNVSPTVLSIKKTVISGNVFTATAYTPTGTTYSVIYVYASDPAPTMVTASIIGNVFMGVPPDRDIINFNGYSGVTEKGNENIP